MLDLLYEKCLLKKERILKRIDEYQSPKEIAKNQWQEIAISESKGYANLAAIDGSSNYKELRSFVIYALGAESVIYNGQEIIKLREAEVDILKPYRFTRDRIRFYMTILENKIALETLRSKQIDFLLMDGSILGDIIRPATFAAQPNKEITEKIISDYYPELLKKQEKNALGINCLDLFEKIEKEFKEQKVEAMMFLEYLENLITIKNLLTYKEKIIGVSKTSQRNDYFKNLNVPDISVFEYTCKNQGYSKPIKIPVSKEVKRSFPIKNLDDFFRNIIFSIFYVRLEDKKNVLKFEIPKILDSNEIENLLRAIKKISPEGYPYLLKKAHKDVIIKDRDIERMIKILGLIAKTGREML